MHVQPALLILNPALPELNTVDSLHQTAWLTAGGLPEALSMVFKAPAMNRWVSLYQRARIDETAIADTNGIRYPQMMGSH